MVQIGMAIVKDVTFRGVKQEFSNVYHYKAPGPGPVQNPDVLINEVVGIERNLHSLDVRFIRASLWSSGGTPAQNAMIHQMALSGTGNQATDSNMDRERAVLMQWPAGLNVLGRPVKLRKWFHSCGRCAGEAFGADALRNEAGITLASRNAIATEANKLRIIGPVDEWLLVAESGREHTGPGTVHQYLEHHQLGDMWR